MTKKTDGWSVSLTDENGETLVNWDVEKFTTIEESGDVNVVLIDGEGEGRVMLSIDEFQFLGESVKYEAKRNLLGDS